jgi:hypothetical protein
MLYSEQNMNDLEQSLLENRQPKKEFNYKNTYFLIYILILLLIFVGAFIGIFFILV